MDMDFVYERLKGLLVMCNPCIDKSTIGVNSDLIDDLGFDSIGFMHLIVAIEEEFGFEFDDMLLLAEDLSSISILQLFIYNEVNRNMS